jgi:ribose 5-phosphate isomerase B
MKIGLVTDHGGFELKEFIKSKLSEKYSIEDYGVHNETSVDYPTVVQNGCKKLLNKECTVLIALCGTGIGASIAANRIKGIRAALCHDEFTAEMAKLHNNANVLVLGGRVLGKDLCMRIIYKWLQTEFEGGRHQRRIDLLENEV